MRRIIGGPIFARYAAQLAPPGYVFFPAGSGYVPGRIFSGPYSDITTTVCLIDGDDGAWFKKLLELRDDPDIGSPWWKEEGT